MRERENAKGLNEATKGIRSLCPLLLHLLLCVRVRVSERAFYLRSSRASVTTKTSVFVCLNNLIVVVVEAAVVFHTKPCDYFLFE